MLNGPLEAEAANLIQAVRYERISTGQISALYYIVLESCGRCFFV